MELLIRLIMEPDGSDVVLFLDELLSYLKKDISKKETDI